MAELESELSALKREIVEARNQAIKTDNQVKNLSLDIKGFENRFESLERRTRMASVGVHAIVAVTIAAAALVVTSIRTASLQEQITTAEADAEQARKTSADKTAEVEARIRDMEVQRQRHAEAAATIKKVLAHLDKGRDREAVSLLPELRIDALTELERSIVDARIKDLSLRYAETAYRLAKAHLSVGRKDMAVTELERSVKLDPNGRYADQARYLTATTLHALKKYDQAEPVLRELRQRTSDRALKEEIKFYLGTTLARIGKHDEARTILKSFGSGRYANSAKVHLAALDAGTPLPGDTEDKKNAP